MAARADASDLHTVGENLLYWSVYEPLVKTELTSCAVNTPQGVILIDPVELSDEGLRKLLDFGNPIRIVMTNGNHLRAAEFYRKHFQLPIAATSQASEDAGISPDESILGGDNLSGFTVEEINGAGPGEVALSGFGIICLGDAIINLPSHPFELLPVKYCSDSQKLPGSLRKLLQYDFEVMTFAHGSPVLGDARQRLKKLLQ